MRKNKYEIEYILYGCLEKRVVYSSSLCKAVIEFAQAFPEVKIIGSFER